MAKKKTIHYIDNSKFLEEMIKHRDAVSAAKLKDKIPPPVPEYIGECFMKIAQRLSFRPNFINYAFKDDMISDGIENCLQYIHNFNPEKSTNPFAYFTQIIYYAFIRRIQKEKKQLYIKYKAIENHDFITQEEGEYYQAPDVSSDFKTNMHKFIETFEKNKKKKSKKQDTILDFYMGETACA
jgi:DNA-directed RNA polymerase specialized sigma subunit